MKKSLHNNSSKIGNVIKQKIIDLENNRDNLDHDFEKFLLNNFNKRS
jgi:hypothetical protein